MDLSLGKLYVKKVKIVFYFFPLENCRKTPQRSHFRRGMSCFILMSLFQWKQVLIPTGLITKFIKLFSGKALGKFKILTPKFKALPFFLMSFKDQKLQTGPLSLLPVLLWANVFLKPRPLDNLTFINGLRPGNMLSSRTGLMQPFT